MLGFFAQKEGTTMTIPTEQTERWMQDLSRLALGFGMAVIAFDLCLLLANIMHI